MTGPLLWGLAGVGGGSWAPLSEGAGRAGGEGQTIPLLAFSSGVLECPSLFFVLTGGL